MTRCGFCIGLKSGATPHTYQRSFNTHSENPWWSEFNNGCKVGNSDCARKAAGISQHAPSPLDLFTVSRRGSQHLANSKIQEVQKATLSGGTCNPFIQPYVFIFWILCVTCAALVCFVPFSASVQKNSSSFFSVFKHGGLVRPDSERHSGSWNGGVPQ